MYFIPTYVRREDTIIKGVCFGNKGKVLLEHPVFMRDKLGPINLTPNMAIIPIMENWADFDKFLSLYDDNS